jgi:CheY-like chemotaxis protein
LPGDGERRSHALRYEGFGVDEAATGRQALAAAARQEPDLIVLDWVLPDLDGIEVGRRLRGQGFKSDYAAVAEAHGGTVDARSEAGHGTTFRIVLPLSPEQHNGAS